MTPMVVGDYVKAMIWCSQSEQASVNSWWYVVGAVGGTAATDQDVADGFDLGFGLIVPPLLSSAAAYAGVQVQLYRPGTKGPFAITAPVFQNGSAGPGLSGPIPLPRQTCGLLSFQTPLPGPKNRGRFYVPFPATTADTGGGIPNAGYTTDLLTLVASLDSGQSISTGGRTATLVRALIHRPDKNGVIIPPTQVTGGTVAAKWATQRRRGSFGRPNRVPF